MVNVTLREAKGVPASLAVSGKHFVRGVTQSVSDDLAAELAPHGLFDISENGKVHRFTDPQGNIHEEIVKTKRSNHINPPPTIEDKLGPSVQPITFTPTRRRDMSILFRGPMVSGHSISQVMRNLTVAAWRDGIDAHCTKIDVLPEYPTFLAAVDYLVGDPKRDYVTVAWDPTVKQWNGPEYARVHIDPSDSFRYVHQNVVQQYASDEVGLLFTLSELCKQRWVTAGVPADKVVVLPLGVDPVVFNPEGLKHSLSGVDWVGKREPDEDTFVFLIAGYLQHRKGVPDALEAYLNEFSDQDNVAIVVKNCSGFAWGKDIRPMIRRLTEKRGIGAPTLGYFDSRLSDWEFASLIRRADCVINSHRMEGFGLIPLQAMACGTLSVVTDYHGPTVYANKQNAIMIPVAGEVPAVESGIPAGVVWADFKQDDVQAALRQAFGGKNNSTLIRNAIETAGEYTWSRSAQVIVDAIEDHVAPVRKRPMKWVKKDCDLSVVMPVRGSVGLLGRMLETLYQNTVVDFETVVLDDKNTPEDLQELELLRKRYGFRLLHSANNIGCHAARQMLFEAARGDFIASVDGDLDFRATEPGWDEKLIVKAMERDGIVHPLLVSWPNGDGAGVRVQSAGGTIPEGSPAPGLHRFAYAPVKSCREYLERPAELVYACGAFQMFSAAMLDHVIMDGEYWPAYFGDVDFCYRARRADHPVWYCPEVVVIHDAGAWTGKNLGPQINQWWKNQTRFIQRWGDMVEYEKEVLDATGALKMMDPEPDASVAIDFALREMKDLPVRPIDTPPVLNFSQSRELDLNDL